MPAAPDESAAKFNPLGLIHELNEHRVEFIVIGGYAAGVQGAGWVTIDLDIVYASKPVNYERLGDALASLDAQPVGLPTGLNLVLDARALRAGDLWTLSTRLGRLDLMREPAPGLGYERLVTRARTIHGRETYRVASLEDLVVMKRAAGRPKDIGHVDILETAIEAMADDPAKG